MKFERGLWVGAFLLLAISGCSNEDSGSGTINDNGVYSPLITGIASSSEPAIRGIENQLTVLVTNVNNLPLTYHWSDANGGLLDSTAASVRWLAPNEIGSFPVTVSITAQDGDQSFFKQTTFQIYVENDYVRWTNSPEVQFDPAPTIAGGVVYAQFLNAVTGQSAAFSMDGPGLAASQLTTGFFSVASPTLRADGGQLAFAGKVLSGDPGPSIWLLPGAGGDAVDAVPAALRSPPLPAPQLQTILGNARFARSGSWLLYHSDSTSIGNPRPWYRDAFNLNQAPFRLLASAGTNAFYQPNWGPDTDQNGLPDSVICPSFRLFGTSVQIGRGIFKLSSQANGTAPSTSWLPDSSAAEVDWSPDGAYIAYTKQDPITRDRDIWIISSLSSDPSTATRVTHGPADDSHPRFSPDGSTIFFVSNRADRYGLNGIYNVERRGTNIWAVTGFDRP
jgi:hypothetical protein